MEQWPVVEFIEENSYTTAFYFAAEESACIIKKIGKCEKHGP